MGCATIHQILVSGEDLGLVRSCFFISSGHQARTPTKGIKEGKIADRYFAHSHFCPTGQEGKNWPGWCARRCPRVFTEYFNPKFGMRKMPCRARDVKRLPAAKMGSLWQAPCRLNPISGIRVGSVYNGCFSTDRCTGPKILFWFSRRRHRTFGGILPSRNNGRLACHWPKNGFLLDLSFYRKPIYGRFGDGMLLSHECCSFLAICLLGRGN